MAKIWKIFIVTSRHWLPIKVLLEEHEIEIEAPAFSFRRRQPRKKRVDILSCPLLPGVIFVAQEMADDAIKIAESRDMRLRTLPSSIGSGLCKDDELEGLRLAAAKRTDIRSKLLVGDRVQIDFGPFKGKTAVITRMRRDSADLIVEGLSWRTVISPFLLRKITS
ncbi:MAG: hypothetical protein ACK5XN_37605 [Bacteroidota bacterium]